MAMVSPLFSVKRGVAQGWGGSGQFEELSGSGGANWRAAGRLGMITRAWSSPLSTSLPTSRAILHVKSLSQAPKAMAHLSWSIFEARKLTQSGAASTMSSLDPASGAEARRRFRRSSFSQSFHVANRLLPNPPKSGFPTVRVTCFHQTWW